MSAGESGKVVNLQSYERERGGIGSAEAKRVLTECRDRISEYLAGAVSATFDKVDDTLFERADKAVSDNEQTIYFDAMREIRRRRSEIEKRTRQLFLERFAEVLKRKPGDATTSSRAGDSGLSLSLIEHEDLEESLAASSMASKVRSTCHRELFELEKRLQLILRRKELKNEDNPIGPEVICGAFRDACHDIDVDVKAKLIVLKLFDKLAIPGLQALYQAINQYLIKNKILPTISHQVKRPAYQRPPMAPVPPQTSDLSGAYEQPGYTSGEINLYQALHHYVTGGAPGVSGGAPMSGGVPLAPAVLGPVVDALTAMQHGLGITNGGDATDGGQLAGGTVNVLREIKTAPGLQPLVSADGVTIDIVALIFDHILDNADVPPAMKALIGRLQIPVLKVAIIDKTFFASRNHPARRLLDTLARAATGWQESESRSEGSLYSEVESSVETVLREFNDDITLFAELADHLSDFIDNELNRAERVEERSAKALEGEERVMMAKVIVRDEIDRRVNKQSPPEPVTAFLRDHWYTVLLLYFLREGEEGNNWRRCVELMDTLLWSVQPKRTDRERQRLVGALGWLLEGLQEGMAMASTPEALRHAFLADLKQCHSQALSEGRSQQAQFEADNRQKELEAQRINLTGIEAYKQDIASVVPDLAEIPELTEEEVMDYVDFSDPKQEANPEAQAEERRQRYEELVENLRENQEQVEIEEITIGNPSPEPEPDSDDHYTAMVAELQKGTWVEFTRADGTTVRGKLSWTSPLTGTYLFTNRQGLKVEDRTKRGLALEFRRGTAKLIEEKSLLDQALSNILGKKPKTAANHPTSA